MLIKLLIFLPNLLLGANQDQGSCYYPSETIRNGSHFIDSIGKNSGNKSYLGKLAYHHHSSISGEHTALGKKMIDTTISTEQLLGLITSAGNKGVYDFAKSGGNCNEYSGHGAQNDNNYYACERQILDVIGKGINDGSISWIGVEGIAGMNFKGSREDSNRYLQSFLPELEGKYNALMEVAHDNKTKNMVINSFIKLYGVGLTAAIIYKRKKNGKVVPVLFQTDEPDLMVQTRNLELKLDTHQNYHEGNQADLLAFFKQNKSVLDKETQTLIAKLYGKTNEDKVNPRTRIIKQDENIELVLDSAKALRSKINSIKDKVDFNKINKLIDYYEDLAKFSKVMVERNKSIVNYIADEIVPTHGPGINIIGNGHADMSNDVPCDKMYAAQQSFRANGGANSVQ